MSQRHVTRSEVFSSRFFPLTHCSFSHSFSHIVCKIVADAVHSSHSYALFRYYYLDLLSIMPLVQGSDSSCSDASPIPLLSLACFSEFPFRPSNLNFFGASIQTHAPEKISGNVDEICTFCLISLVKYDRKNKEGMKARK